MSEFCEKKGIKKEFNVARTPQQNGVAERRNKILTEVARTMLADSKLPTTFWAKVVNTACYVQNRILVVRLYNKTPYELFRGRTPALSFMRPFGCHVTILNTLDYLGKFDGKSDEGFFVGYSLNSKAFRVYNIRTRKVKESLHIRFLVDKPIIAGDGPKWLIDIDVLTKLMNYVPVVTSTNSNDLVDSTVHYLILFLKNNSNDEPKPSSVMLDKYDDESTNDKYGSLNINIVSLTVTTALLKATHANFFGDGTEIDMSNISATYLVPSTSNSREESIKNHSLGSCDGRAQKVWILVDLPHGKRAIGTKWVYKNKKDERGILIRNKARLVAQGYTQEEGIDYDEVFALVARIKAIRLFLAYASFKDFVVYQIDVKSAFLYGKIEDEVYVCQPPGFEDPEFPDKVYKVEKALYGLHQAPRAWYETLSTYLLDNRFQRGQIDKTLFIKRVKSNILLVQVYVDDIIFGSTKKKLFTEFEILMYRKFQMSSMGELTFFLGLQVTQKDDRIFISQDKYVDEILKKFGFLTVKTASIPMETSKPLLKDAEAKDVDVNLYRSMIGSLMYLTSSRPDIMFFVCAYAIFQVTPKVLHLHAVKRIFRYLKGQPKLGLWYPKDSPFDLEAYSDSDYAGASLDRKSTTGERRRQFEAQRLQEKRNKPMTFAQQKHFMRTFVKNQSSAIYSTGWTLKYVKTFTDDQLKAEFDKIRNAVADLQAQNLRRSLKRPGADVEQPGSKKSKSSAAPQTPVPAASHQSSAGVTTNVHQSPFVDSPPSTPAATPDTSVDPPVSRSSGPRTRSHSSAAGIKTYSTRRKSLATRKMSSSEVDLNAPDNSFIHVLSDDDSNDSDDDTNPFFWHAFATWEVVPTGLGDVNALYFTDKFSIYFTHLREILHLLDRQDLSKLYGMIVKHYEVNPLAGTGMILWGDLHVLFESTTGGSSVEVGNDQQEWVIHSWKLFPFSGVHVLETFTGKILYMFTDTPYPLSASLMQKMLKHKLEVEIDGLFNSQVRLDCDHLGVNITGSKGLPSPQANGYVGKVASPEQTAKGPDRLASPRVNGYLVKASSNPFTFYDSPLPRVNTPWDVMRIVCNPELMDDTEVVQIWYVVPTGRVIATVSIKVPTGKYIVPAGYPQKKQPRRKQRKDAEVPQPSGSTEPITDEAQERNDDNLMFDTGVFDEEEVEVEKVVSTAKVTTANATTTNVDELTLAQTLIEMKAAKPKAVTTAATTTTTAVTRPKARGVVVKEPSEFTTTTSQPSQLPQAKDKGKGKMVEPEKPLKKKDQILVDEEIAQRLQEELQAELEEEERLSRQKKEEDNLIS
ncbi:putative ribonuclease H-like domain-containing protein [Tanacetum coccineum]